MQVLLPLHLDQCRKSKIVSVRRRESQLIDQVLLQVATMSQYVQHNDKSLDKSLYDIFCLCLAWQDSRPVHEIAWVWKEMEWKVQSWKSLRFFFVVNKPCLPDIPLKKWLFRTGLVSDAFGKSAAVRSDLVIDSIEWTCEKIALQLQLFCDFCACPLVVSLHLQRLAQSCLQPLVHKKSTKYHKDLGLGSPKKR